jgi:tripartite-type tricarboxylate transporter receptor subunit TctC
VFRRSAINQAIQKQLKKSGETTMKLAAIFAALAFSTSLASAQDYPTRTITMVVPYAAGGPTDTISRLTADAMSKALGQQVIVENVGGAGGTLGARRVADAEPDGYTILTHHVGMSTAPALYRQLPFDPQKAFLPVGLVSDAAMTLIARDDFPPKDMKEMVAYLKEKGTGVTYANAGIGAASHLCGVLLQSMLGVQMTTVPYKGNGPIMTDLLGKQIDTTCDQATNTVGPIKENKVKAYSITSPTRSEMLPDVPTSAESGFPKFEVSVWHGIYAPAGTPDAVVKKLTAALQAAMDDATLKQRFAQIATTPASKADATPAALAERLDSEIKRWGPILKAAGQFAD